MTEFSQAPATPRQGSWRRFVPLAVLLTAMAIVFATGWHRELTLENIVSVRDRFQLFLQDHKLQSVLCFVAVYVSVVVLSLPGAGILSITSGLFFGTVLGALTAITGGSIGAIILFLIVAKTGFGDVLVTKAGPAVAKLQAGFKDNALSYLFFLRLVPAFPFFVVNIVSGLIGMPLRTYIIGTVFGVMPASFAFASIGAGLDSVVAAAKAEYATCVAAKGQAVCHLSLHIGNLVTTELKIAFALLGALALIPVLYKKWSKSHVAA